ncbi:hypothetical protein TNCV_3490111 [Trichonephila clavipes]|nr:hypothetical protein TNCV_3490111 [Trichonephila clavipes]
MNVCKCIVPSRHGGSLNSRRAASPLVSLVEGGREVSGLKIFGWKRQNHTVTCMVLKAKANDRRKTLALSHDEFCGP